ncbi:DUF4265 domain-containing protein [Burkholderia cepacia]|uniref:DUF4265 domain-containing protein n=1 Tax=Burkholderia cepacia TaxID=292 RepID=A0A8I1DN06_BURCE|nr:DUF4265 domain-containing protein [Burkholderia cepacia]MBA9901913.1 DUF4265 domain-containing protein [Burkholderia cepacia]MBA9948880.1 DUF4265 domain-containing protein [Burkholderia cepacia]MBA9979166.1 DUF4265 domain-containing protein [Burkholderia cepacia]MBA9997850.1 DUF4265 domain-containing protein [Burkholderia cepacia]MBB0005881.1 DUF4265 domain-containing protein [Burkholderia cepacia]
MLDPDQDDDLIHVYAGSSGDAPVHEELPARQIEPGIYELLASPGLVLNLAKGDLVRMDDPDRPPTVLKRGGNYCIQIYGDAIPDHEIDRLASEVESELSGTLDGRYGGSLALSVPSGAGGERIRTVFDGFTARTGLAWYYANIYRNFEDPDDETLLDWWLEP